MQARRLSRASKALEYRVSRGRSDHTGACVVYETGGPHKKTMAYSNGSSNHSDQEHSYDAGSHVKGHEIGNGQAGWK
jgi:hypothetical protein